MVVERGYGLQEEPCPGVDVQTDAVCAKTGVEPCSQTRRQLPSAIIGGEKKYLGSMGPDQAFQHTGIGLHPVGMQPRMIRQIDSISPGRLKHLEVFVETPAQKNEAQFHLTCCGKIPGRAQKREGDLFLDLVSNVPEHPQAAGRALVGPFFLPG
jgi:hypothetical protein